MIIKPYTLFKRMIHSHDHRIGATVNPMLVFKSRYKITIKTWNRPLKFLFYYTTIWPWHAARAELLNVYPMLSRYRHETMTKNISFFTWCSIHTTMESGSCRVIFYWGKYLAIIYPSIFHSKRKSTDLKQKKLVKQQLF